MAFDKVVDSALLDAGMQATADAIREKTGSTDPIVWDSANGFKTAVEGIQAGGGDDGSFKAVIERTAVNPTLPADLTKIGNYAFYGSTNLALTSLPNSVTSIGENAFDSCKNLVLTSLPDSLTSIGKKAFWYCSKLALTSLPKNLRTIGANAFAGCDCVAFTSLPENITYVDNSTFNSCKNIKTLYLPKVLNIYSNAFAGCSGLEEVTFGSKASIASSSFSSCPNLLTINVPWAEGEVSGAPWSATNATINYNYTGG